MNQLTSDMCIEGMADSLQVELSTTGLAVLGKLTSALMADLRPRGRGAQMAGVEGGQTGRPRRPAALQLQLKCNSLNVFTCTDTGGSLGLPSLNLSLAEMNLILPQLHPGLTE